MSKISSIFIYLKTLTKRVAKKFGGKKLVPEIDQKCFICGKPWKKGQDSCHYCGGKNKVASFKSEKDMEQLSSLKLLFNSLKPKLKEESE